MISVVRDAVRPGAAQSDVMLLYYDNNYDDLSILTATSWPLLFHTLHEVVVQIGRTFPTLVMLST